MKKFLLLFSIALIFQSCAVRKANKRFEKMEYDRAIDLYMRSYKPEDAELNYKIAEAYRRSNRLAEAATYYNAAMQGGIDEDEVYYYFAKSLKAINDYDQARQVLEDYLKNPRDEQFAELARNELENLNDLKEVKEKPNFFRIKNLDKLNTAFAEYSPVYKNNYLYFTSNRESRNIYLVTGKPFTDLYRVRTRGANINDETIEVLDEIINDAEVNEGSLAISSDGSSIIFAKGNTGKATGNTEVNLYFTRYRNGRWTEPRPLSVNDPESWDSTPALTPDGTTLYFASTRPGGYGGADLYSAQLTRRGRWTDVKNLGPAVNTPGDEVFPFVSEDGRLYFSSTGHPGFGNLDLFVATRAAGTITVENLGEPINSSSDDFALYQFDLTRGFFSSNRPGGQGDDDIYTFVNDDPDLKIVNYYLTGTTVTTDGGGHEMILPNTKVVLATRDGEILNETFTGDDGTFRFRVYSEENYDLIGEKTDYFTTRKHFTTVDKSVDKSTLTEFITNVSFETKLHMDRIIIEKPIVLNNIYYDLDKAEIRPDAAVVLDSLVQIMNDNPEIYIELGSHTDTRADDDYNMDLSRRRARSAVEYIIKHGIEPARITARGYGETQLIIFDAQTEEEHQKNRRTEFKVLKYNPGEREEEDLPPTEDYDEYDRFFDTSG